MDESFGFLLLFQKHDRFIYKSQIDVDKFKSVSVYPRREHNAKQHIMFSLDQTIVVQPLAMPEEGQGREVGDGRG